MSWDSHTLSEKFISIKYLEIPNPEPNTNSFPFVHELNYSRCSIQRFKLTVQSTPQTCVSSEVTMILLS